MENTEKLTRFTESISIDNKLIKRAEVKELNESISRMPSKLKESSDNTNGWWVPVSWYNKKNGNGRIYSKKLWENVLNNQRDNWVGAPMLADHPEGDSDGSPKNICGVWIDGKMEDPVMYEDGRPCGMVYGLLIPSGHIGEDLKDHLKNGLRVGTSSSGFGKLMSDGETVDPDSYQIERLSDWVCCPSQQSYFSYDGDSNTVYNSSTDYEESLERKENVIKETKTNKVNIIKENTVNTSKITKLEEKKFRRDMESFLESADNIKDPQERLEEFREIESYLEDGACPDLKEKIENKIKEQEEYIKTALKEKEELKTELNIENPKDLKEKLTKIAEDAKQLDREAKDWKVIAEKLQNKLTETKKELDSRHSDTYVAYQKSKISHLEEELCNQNKESEEFLNEIKEQYGEVRENLENSKKECAELNEKLEAALKERKAFENSSAVIARKLEEAKKELENTKSLLEESNSRNQKLSSAVIGFRQKMEEAVTENKKLKEMYEAQAKNNVSLTRSLEKKERTIKEAIKKGTEESLNASKTSVDLYYESLYRDFGNDIVPFKDKILGCRTLAEAKRYFFQEVLQNMRETKNIDSTRLPENLTYTKEDRANYINSKKFKKSSIVDRMPQGWL